MDPLQGRYRHPPIRQSTTKRAWLYLVTLILTLPFFVACSQPEIQALRFGAPVWADGETSVYQLTDIDGAYAGTATYTLVRQAEDRWTMSRTIDTQGMQELVFVEMVETGYRPRSAMMVRDDGSAQERVSTTYSGGQVDLELTTKQDVTTVQRENIPSDALDQRTLPMLVRTLPLDASYATRVNAFLPVLPRLFRVTIVFHAAETVEVPAGTFTAWPVDLDAGEITSRIWIGTELPHPTVKIEDGANGATFELLEFEPDQATSTP